jgi:preprotein translocase SecE subunit
MKSIFSKLTAFFRETVNEVKNLHFPSKRETYITTVVIICVIAVVSLTILLVKMRVLKNFKDGVVSQAFPLQDGYVTLADPSGVASPAL